jgi:hypothetical protein
MSDQEVQTGEVDEAEKVLDVVFPSGDKSAEVVHPRKEPLHSPAPAVEDGEMWRALRVTFPDGIASHCREQISYFGPDGLLRRHEYRVDVLGGALGLNYAHEFREVDGIMVAMKRRVYSFDGDNARCRIQCWSPSMSTKSLLASPYGRYVKWLRFKTRLR